MANLGVNRRPSDHHRPPLDAEGPRRLLNGLACIRERREMSWPKSEDNVIVLAESEHKMTIPRAHQPMMRLPYTAKLGHDPSLSPRDHEHGTRPFDIWINRDLDRQPIATFRLPKRDASS